MPLAPQIPPMPHVRAEALRMLHEDVPAARLADVLRRDPALTGVLLRAANSALSAPVHRIADVREAVIRVGLDETRRLVQGTVLHESFPLRDSGIVVDELWRHLATVAVLAESSPQAGEHASHAFTAGLLHDVGRMALAAEQPAAYARVCSLVGRGVSPIAAERAIFGVDHAEAGVEVAEAWNLPEPILEAIAWHHSDPLTGVARAVAEARTQAAEQGVGDGLAAPPETARPAGKAKRSVDEVVRSRVDRYCAVVASV